MTVYVDTSVVLRILLQEQIRYGSGANGTKPILARSGAWKL
jgi:hypothetical protein